MSDPEDRRDLESARRAAEASGVPIPDERLALFAASLDGNTQTMRRLLAVDYRETEPASRFRAPPPR
jgi:hypothetical protein